MAAKQTLAQIPQSGNSLLAKIPLQPSHGVMTLQGYGIDVRVDRGHLITDDGIGPERRQARLSRVDHGLRRLVIVGADGVISLAALRWLADQNASFVMLDRDGSVLATTGPVRSSDARLRRAQALAHHSGAALRLARELIKHKLAAQEHVAREKLLDDSAADVISQCRAALDHADTVDKIRSVESKGASAYWSLWRDLPIMFPKKDLPRVPKHWRSFGTRVSPLTGSQRLAVNPPNAILNYLYALLEAEARLAAAALGLDPGLAFLHVDTPARDSLACDLMEPVRPLIDGYLLDWITREPLRREWFFEERNGNCRLMSSLTFQLSGTTSTWARSVAPFAEWVARILWTTSKASAREPAPSTRLTHRRRTEGRGYEFQPVSLVTPRRSKICPNCGADIRDESTVCRKCSMDIARKNMVDIARAGRVLAQSREAQVRRRNTNRMHAMAVKQWKPTDNPAWLNEETYRKRIHPRLAEHTIASIATAINISEPYAADIRSGRRMPHPRHWRVLAQLVRMGT